jgi:hypothetical protein
LTVVTLAWNIDERDSGGNARTRWPTLTYRASSPVRAAVMIRLPAAMRPAARTQTWIGRTAASFNVSVSSLACSSVIGVSLSGLRRMRSRML